MAKSIFVSESAFSCNGITGATNLGGTNAGNLYTSVSLNNLQFKSLSGGSNVNITCNGNYVIISSTGGGISCATFNYYTGTTAPNTYLSKTAFNTYSGTTVPNTYLTKTVFSTYTGTTAPNTYLSKTAFNTYSGTTVPNTYYNKTQINTYTGRTQTIFTDWQDPTGWVNGSTIDISYNYSQRTVTLTGDLSYYWNGVKKSLTSPWTSSAHSASVGQWFLYSTDGTNFSWSQSVWNFTNLMTAMVYYQSTSGSTFGIRESHGLMPWTTHQSLDKNIGTYLYSGGLATNYTEKSATDAGVSPDFNSAVVADEDLQTTIPALSKGAYTVMYISGNTSVYSLSQTVPFLAPAGTNYIYVNTPSTGALTTGVANRFYNVYQILVPTTSDNGSQKYRMIFLQPQQTFTTLTSAQAEDTRGLFLGSLSSSSAEFVPYARITYSTSNSNANYGKVTIPTGGVTYVVGTRMGLTSVNGISSSNHATLSNLTWSLSGHLGTNSSLAAFNATGDACNKLISDLMSWTGSTANGVATYTNACRICSNPNMTFDGSILSVSGIISGTTICGGTVCSTGIIKSSTCGCIGTCAIIGTDIILTTGAERCIKFNSASAGVGSNLTIRGNDGATSSNGGNTYLCAGYAGFTSGNGGAISIQAGDAYVGAGGPVYVKGGYSPSGGGGSVILCAGNSTANGYGGTVIICAGAGGTCIGGDVCIEAGAGTVGKGQVNIRNADGLKINTFAGGTCIACCAYIGAHLCATTCICSPIICATTGFYGCATNLTAGNSNCLDGVLASCYSLKSQVNYYTGTTAPATYLGKTATACNSACLGGVLATCYQQKAGIVTYTGTTAPATYLGKTATACNSACLGGVLASSYARKDNANSFSSNNCFQAVTGTTICTTNNIISSGVICGKGVVKAYRYGNSTALPAITLDKGGSYAMGIGADGTSMRIRYGAVDNMDGTAWIDNGGIQHYFDGTVYASTCLCSPLICSTGTITASNVRKIKPYNLTEAANTCWDMNCSMNAALNLTASRCLCICNVTSGDTGNLKVVQCGSGSYCLTLPTPSKKVSGYAQSTAVGSIDILSFYYDGSNYYWNIGKNYT